MASREMEKDTGVNLKSAVVDCGSLQLTAGQTKEINITTILTNAGVTINNIRSLTPMVSQNVLSSSVRYVGTMETTSGVTIVLTNQYSQPVTTTIKMLVLYE